MPIADENKLKEFIVRQLDLKDASPSWRVEEVQSLIFFPFGIKILTYLLEWTRIIWFFLTSWWSNQPNPAFLDREMQQIFLFGQEGSGMHANLSSKLSGGDYDLALALFVENFFTNFQKNSAEEQLWETFRDFLSMDFTLKAESTSEG